jgi:hypothetical protein
MRCFTIRHPKEELPYQYDKRTHLHRHCVLGSYVDGERSAINVGMTISLILILGQSKVLEYLNTIQSATNKGK